jgi:hypothetical protein
MYFFLCKKQTKKGNRPKLLQTKFNLGTVAGARQIALTVKVRR